MTERIPYRPLADRLGRRGTRIAMVVSVVVLAAVIGGLVWAVFVFCPNPLGGAQ